MKFQTLPALLCVLAGIAFAQLSPAALAQGDPPAFSNARARVVRPAAGQTLTPASQAAPAAVVGSYLQSQGATVETAASLRVTSQSRTERTGITHVRMEQVIDGLAVYGAYVKAALNDRSELVHLIESVAVAPAGRIAPAARNELDALRAAMAHVHPGVEAAFTEKAKDAGKASFAGGAFFHSDPTVTRVAVRMTDGALRAGYLVETWTQKENLLHHTIVSGDGEVLFVEVRTNNDSYNVFVEDPGKGGQAVVNGPGAANAESPAGWLSGSQTTVNIKGNNANAYLDVDANNAADSGGTAVTDGNFLTVANLAQQPSTTANRAVAVQNLFYLNNVVHDILYSHGFDEPAGNFQANNFGKGGAAGSDPVNAEAQDGSGTDNANFSTPPDGQTPRMQMYLWSAPGPDATVTITSTSPATTYQGKLASFAPQPTTTGVSGSIVKVNDGVAAAGGGTTTDACEKLQRNSLKGKIALVDRGLCTFVVKVSNAQAAGAIAVIVANNTGGTIISAMGGSSSGIRIPAVMISQNDGALLRGLPSPVGRVAKNAVSPPMIDGDVDSDIVYHEYGHGLTWRMIGSMSGAMSGAIGEGASDTLAFLINGDDRIGEYSSSNPGGIRRAPYAGYPNTYNDFTGTGVHADGEIYAAAMWKVLENYLAAGLSAADVRDDWVNGMNFTPAGPAFEDMRDGMLQATAGSGRECLIWRGFAAQGVGVGANGRVSPVVESFALPATCP